MIVQNEDDVRRFIEALPNAQRGIALDLGANFGLYTDLLATKFEWVYAFEPDPNNMNVLKRNVTARNVTFKPHALGVADNAWVKLYRANNPGSSTTNEEAPKFGGWGHSWDNYSLVPTITLDTFWFTEIFFEQVKFIKCDVEGAEDYIFEHGKDLLHYNDLTMVLECHQPVNFDRLYKLFTDCDYKIYDIQFNPVDHLNYDAYFIIRKELHE